MATRHTVLTDPLPVMELHPELQADALRRAAWTLAAHAEDLARAMQAGAVEPRDGVAALRLFAAVVRAADAAPAARHRGPAGRA
ncbi:hypothetical protein C8P66_105133 [Humitalea rosea]|uniref:Uncharacterized protein n=1 Tax=Humitalea rosea TaxID=990373 RepID=A0A2W7IS19_9PROT|nr:hypothetical protein [Humitalea rosea]PZW48384.1 hypothetical protein C8P66_105133 [Humitalea rosea]